MRKRLKEGEKYFWFSVRRERKKGGKLKREEGRGGRKSGMVYYCLGNVIVRGEWWDRR